MAVGRWLFDRASAEIVPLTPKAAERRNFVWLLTRPLPAKGQNAQRPDAKQVNVKRVIAAWVDAELADNDNSR